jgi:hypothetical protein
MSVSSVGSGGDHARKWNAIHPEGAALVQSATELNQLRSGCHRPPHELIDYGYVRQLPLGTTRSPLR